MDKRALLLMMAVMMLLLFAWPQIIGFIARTQGWDITPPKPVDATTQPIPQATTAEQTATTPAATVQPTSGLRVAPATQPASTLTLGSPTKQDAAYRMALALAAEGAGIDSVVLNEFKRAVESDDPFLFQQPFAASVVGSRPFSTQTITINGTTLDIGAAQWELIDVSHDPAAARFRLTIVGDDGPVLHLFKTYRLSKPDDPNRGYEVEIAQGFENLTGQPIKLRVSFNGPTVPPREQDRGGDRQTLGGYLKHARVYVEHNLTEEYKPDNPTRELTRDSDGNPLLWAGASSIYFNAIARPLPLAQSNEPPGYIERVEAKLADANPPAGEHPVHLRFTTTELELAAGKSLELPIRAFFGPRQRNLLNSDYFTAFPVGLDKTLVLSSGPCAVCTWPWLVNLLVKLLVFFHMILRDWGLAIIALVVLVRLILHPVTKRSQIAMAKMGKMGPEMERLKKKYGDNKEELTKAMWEMQKQQGIGPYLGCLPMFLQMPIWIALWQALWTTFELRQAPFLWGWTWIHDLSKPDHLIEFPYPLFANVWFLPTISGINILPILMGVVFWIQMKIQPKPAAMTPEQAQQQKMMLIMMPFLFPLMLYSGPSGLNLYIMTSTLLGIIEAKIVRDHIKAKEEAEKAGRVIVDAGSKFKGRGGGAGQSRPKGTPPEKPRGILGWFAELQERAEQIRREAEKRK